LNLAHTRTKQPAAEDLRRLKQKCSHLHQKRDAEAFVQANGPFFGHDALEGVAGAAVMGQ